MNHPPEPERVEGFLERVRARDNVGLKRQAEAVGPVAWRSDATRGALARDCALYKVSRGEVDPRSLLRRFDVPAALPVPGGGSVRGDHG